MPRYLDHGVGLVGRAAHGALILITTTPAAVPFLGSRERQSRKPSGGVAMLQARLRPTNQQLPHPT